MDVNTWWISDEIRHRWTHVHAENRPLMPRLRGEAQADTAHAAEAWQDARDAGLAGLEQAGHIAVMLSPMLSCEDAWHLATCARVIDPNAVLAMGPVPFDGEDETFPGGYTIRAEKAPNARGVRRVLEHFGDVMDAHAFEHALAEDGSIKAVVLTGNYPTEWATPSLRAAIGEERFVLLMDTVTSDLLDRADVFMPACTWMEKAGTFQNAGDKLQSFHKAIDPVHYCKSEAQIALDLQADAQGCPAAVYNDAATRQTMADAGIDAMRDAAQPVVTQDELESDMEYVPLSVSANGGNSGGCGSGGCGCN